MGHQHLGVLPGSLKWRQIVDLIGGGANVADVAAATSAAAESQLGDASDDPAVKHSFWLLTQILIAARTKDFGAELRERGLQVSDSPTLSELTVAMSDAIDREIRRSGGRTDLGEMAQLSALESLHAVAGSGLADLFGPGDDRTASVLAGLGTVKQFAVLSRDFFSRLVRRQLTYFLSRELPKHVGSVQRFTTTREHQEFEATLDLHCREASRIIKEFSGQWFSKRIYEGGIDRDAAGRFVHIAFNKIREELLFRRSADARA